MRADQLNREVFDHILFLLTAARGCVDEPHMYGPLRLIDAVSRIISIYFRVGGADDEFLDRLKRVIDEKKYIVMESEDEFIKFIEELIAESVEEMKKRRISRYENRC
ncbi:MAG: DUF6092 family protein [Nitrososphaerota archaeon]